MQPMNDSANELLVSRIEKRLAEIGTSAAAASVKAGLSNSYIRDLKRRKANPNVASLSKLAGVLGVSTDYLLKGREDGAILTASPVNTLKVVGMIKAGDFRDISLASQDEEYETINVAADRRFSAAAQYALLVSGDSMDKIFPDGSYVTCVEFVASGLDLRPGMVVHIERSMGGGQFVETTLKEIGLDDGEIVFRPRSSNPKHKTIRGSDNGGMEVQVRGVVTGKWEPVSF